MKSPRLILIPGMGADARLFEPQRAFGFHFEVPELPVPRPRDSMSSYAARIREQLELTGPCVIGGVSFGGMLACELARLCAARCVLLVASCRRCRSVPRSYRLAELASRLIPDFFIKRRAEISGRLLAAVEPITPEQKQLIMQMSRDINVLTIRRIARMIFSWRSHNEPSCPVHHIHGDSDLIIPLRRVRPDEIVVGGGHLINLSHSEQVNRFIERHLEVAAARPAVA